MSLSLAGRRIKVPCTIEVEHTPRSLHAFVELQGIDVGPGDTVLVHDAPIDVGFGERTVRQSHATVTKAGPIERLWTKLTAFLELTELYEVSFTPRRSL
jgi:hypothetical protein